MNLNLNRAHSKNKAGGSELTQRRAVSSRRRCRNPHPRRLPLPGPVPSCPRVLSPRRPLGSYIVGWGESRPGEGAYRWGAAVAIKVQPKHLGCVGLSCFYLAVKSTEEERNVPLATDLIRISQYRFTVSDLMRMEKIVLEKVCWKVKATTAFQFLQLYYSLLQENMPHERKSSLNFERLEAQLKACYCRIIFSKAKPSVLALSVIALEIQAQKYIELTEGVERLQKHSKISGRDLTFWQELVSKCLAEYSSNKCAKPNVQKLKWIVSGRTARQLRHSYYRITHLPTIPETVP